MPTKPGTAESVGQSVDEQFLALIYSDEELLRAEFDAIIAAQWPGPPERPPRRGAAAGRPTAGAHRRPVAHDAGSVAGPRHPGVGGWSRQRSPPPAQPQPRDTKGQVIAPRE